MYLSSREQRRRPDGTPTARADTPRRPGPRSTAPLLTHPTALAPLFTAAVRVSSAQRARSDRRSVAGAERDAHALAERLEARGERVALGAAATSPRYLEIQVFPRAPAPSSPRTRRQGGRQLYA